tara:strand:- start:1274 stop:2011 length:738 start_codon:yes stop_codon:yes gene_type:complete
MEIEKNITTFVKNSPENWWRYEKINDSLVKEIVEAFSQTKKIKKDWTITPYCTEGRFGRCWSLNEENHNDRFWINVFNGEEYNLKETNYIYVDASFSFIFKYKNRPALYVSFLFDNDKNLYIRQIQGFPNSSLHNKLGTNWKESAIYYVVKNFKTLKNVYLIEEDAIVDAVKTLYRNCYYEELHDPIMDRIKLNYETLRNSICFDKSKVKRFSPCSEHSSIQFKDVYFKVNKKKLANKHKNCYTD